MTDIADVVDLDRYPIANPDAPAARALVAKAKARLADPGSFAMPGFIRPQALRRMAAEAETLVAEGYRREHTRAPRMPGAMGPRWPRETRAAVTCSGGDRMAPDSTMRAIYRWQPLTDFLGTVFGVIPYYRSADEMVGCMLTSYGRGDELGWHFDPNDGVVTLLVQKAGRGGCFEYAPALPKEDPDRLVAAVDAVMDGVWPGTRREDQEAGTLALFNGSRALHRVTPVESEPGRIMLVLSYDSRPGQVFSDDIRMRFFGRTA